MSKDENKKLRRRTGIIGAIRGAGSVLMLVMDAFLVLYWMETVCRGSYQDMAIWMLESTQYAAHALGMIASVLAVLALAFGRLFPAVLLGNAFFYVLGCIHRLKMDLRGAPFEFSDIAMAREATEAFTNLIGGVVISPAMIIGATLLLVIVPLLCLGRGVLRRSGLKRAICLLLACVCCAGYGLHLSSLEMEEVMLLEDDYKARGFLIAFLGGIAQQGDNDLMTEPQGYSREAVLAELMPYAGSKEAPEVLPNILFVMSESLFDMTADLKMSQDPLAYFKQLQQEYWGGNYLTKVYGGGTAIAEYEVLTGYPIEDTNLAFSTSGGSIQSGMDSIISVLKSHGYFTQAIHPNSGSFYGRKSVYTMMGFDRLLFSDNMDTPPKEVFPYPSDEYMFDQIIKAYENRPIGQPWFCHAITYQNHGGYAFETNFSQVHIEEELGDAEMLSAHNYVNMVKLSDDALRRLIEYFDAQEDPTVIVMWGDHAPAVHQFGIEVPQEPIAAMHYYTTPLLIYNNYGMEVAGIPENISAYRLGAYTLHLLGMENDAYFNYLASDDAQNNLRTYGYIERDGEIYADREQYVRAAEKMRLLHYDRLFGERYGEGL